MGRRFGRNQKRRMRAEIAARVEEIELLRMALEMDRGLLRYQTEKLQEADAYAMEVMRLVGRNSIAAGRPGRISLKYSSDDRFQVEAPWGVDRIRIETMRMLETDAVLDRVRGMLHVNARLADGKVRYAVSESALMDADRDWLVNSISRELAKALVTELRGTRR